MVSQCIYNLSVFQALEAGSQDRSSS